MVIVGEQQRLLNVIEVSEIMKVNPQTIRRWIKAGRVPSVELGKVYIKVEDLCQMLGVSDIETSRFGIEKTIEV